MITAEESVRFRNYIIGASSRPEATPSLYELHNMSRDEAQARGLDVYTLWKQHGCFTEPTETEPR